MSPWKYVFRSLRFYWRTNIGILLGASLGVTILVGAFAVGDSVRYSLKKLALSRLGKITYAISTPNRLFRTELADDMAAELGSKFVSILNLPGSAAKNDGSSRANKIQVLGIEDSFWELGNSRSPFKQKGKNIVAINSHLAKRLGIGRGDTMVLRVEKPSFLPRDSILSLDKKSTSAGNVTIAAIISDDQFGRFSLKANQVAPLNVFVPKQWLEKLVGLKKKANLLLAGEPPKTIHTEKELDIILKKTWKLEDIGLKLRSLDSQNTIELSSRRIFLEKQIIQKAAAASPGAIGVLTYFVNSIKPVNTDGSGSSSLKRSTPYSFVSAVGRLSSLSKKRGDAAIDSALSLFPPGSGKKEIIISPWLAEDLKVKKGDRIELSYFVSGPMRNLVEKSSTFRVQRILKPGDPALDRELMPQFPGLANAESCKDWNSGISIDLKKIRKKDEDYWNKFKGTPKAFITLSKGKHLWTTRFGDLTAIHFPNGKGTKKQLESILMDELNPASFGLFFKPVRKLALKASSQALDFGQLFLGLSFFLLTAALLLVGLLFVFGVEQRTEEIGTLLAMGIGIKKIRRLFLSEGLILAAAGGTAGIVCGIMYAEIVLYGLSTVWKGAVNTSALFYHAQPLTLLGGGILGVAVAVLAMWITLRGLSKKQARNLLNLHYGKYFYQDQSHISSTFPTVKRYLTRQLLKMPTFWSGILFIAGAMLIIILSGTGQTHSQTGAFFGAGSLLLLGTLSLCHAFFVILSRRARSSHMTLASLGISNSTRNRFRSLAVVGLLACGSFTIVAVSANRLNPFTNARKNFSGTGGFELFGDSTLPIQRNLQSKAGLKAYGLPPELSGEMKTVQMRVREGDDASCLNMNRAQRPQLIGVQPEAFASRDSFTFVQLLENANINKKGPGSGWRILDKEMKKQTAGTKYGGKTGTISKEKTAGKAGQREAIPAIGDVATVTWGLGKSIGDILEYKDEKGRTFNIIIAGIIARSVFQGSLIISEDNFIRIFPSESGYRMFLFDVDNSRSKEISKILSRTFQDLGMAIIPAEKRLASFNIVENTYLEIFQALGGLGLILGSIGLGVVVMRNVMERRNEFALLSAVGFQKHLLLKLIWFEHWLLVILGMTCGILSALVAVFPALMSPGVGIPYFSLLIIICIIIGSGIFWTIAASEAAFRAPLLKALRNE